MKGKPRPPLGPGQRPGRGARPKTKLSFLRPKIKRCLFDLARPTGKNRADSENFIAAFRPFFFLHSKFFFVSSKK